MILDIQYRNINGSKMLCKLAPNQGSMDFYTVDDEGYLSFDFKKFSWQPVEELKIINENIKDDKQIDVSFFDLKNKNMVEERI